MTHIVGISGSLGKPSRTRALVERVVKKLNKTLTGKVDIIDLADSGHLFWQASYPNPLSDEAQALVASVAAADIIVVGSPVYKGSYSGVFKHFFDLLDPQVLAGKLVILTATGGSDFHALVLEHQLRPLFSFFGAVTAPMTIYAKEADFIDGTIPNARINERINESVQQVLHLFANSFQYNLNPAKAVA
jgi:FMN reductase